MPRPATLRRQHVYGLCRKTLPHQPPAGGSFSLGGEAKSDIYYLKRGDISWFLSQSTGPSGPVNPAWPRHWPRIWACLRRHRRYVPLHRLYAVRGRGSPRRRHCSRTAAEDPAGYPPVGRRTKHIYLNGEDVSDAIRAENIGMAASAASAHRRAYLPCWIPSAGRPPARTS